MLVWKQFGITFWRKLKSLRVAGLSIRSRCSMNGVSIFSLKDNWNCLGTCFQAQPNYSTGILHYSNWFTWTFPCILLYFVVLKHHLQNSMEDHSTISFIQPSYNCHVGLVLLTMKGVKLWENIRQWKSIYWMLSANYSKMQKSTLKHILLGESTGMTK